ncbi:transglycosylase SLT domain-containing protein [candidate division KSB1 bacterium]|nr:transglycosylase SLT domain-containing protein [candidate division KSB1 bacterium]
MKLALLTSLIVITCLSAISFTYKFYSFEETASRMSKLERTLQDLRAAMNVDSVRQYHIHKIMGIIDQYNPKLPAGTKYEIANEIYRMSVKYPNIDVDLICATITHESAVTWRPTIKSEAGAMGLMQIMPTTGILLAQAEGIPWTTPEEILYDPIYNIRLGCRYLSTLVKSYNTDGGLAAYNGGEKRAALWLANNRDYAFLWEETRDYVPAVLKLYEKFKNQGIL